MRCSEYLPGCTRYGKRNECSNRISSRCGFIRDKWRPNSADALALPLPPQLSFLHYVTRPVRLAKVYGAGCMKSVLWDWPN